MFYWVGNLHSVWRGLHLHKKKKKNNAQKNPLGQQTTHAPQTEGRYFQEPEDSPEVWLCCQDEVEVGSNPISRSNLRETKAKNKAKEILKSLPLQQTQQYNATQLIFLFPPSLSEVT